MYSIQSDQIVAVFNAKGAEMISLKHKNLSFDYIWQANPAFWGKHSPVLFPIVGGLKNNSYHYKGNVYTMGRHGFARDKEFIVENKENDQITFLLTADDSSRKVYPFDFEFRVRYKIFETTLMVTYDIININNTETMFTSVGAHPAFNVPIDPNLVFEDYLLEFNEKENAPIFPLTPEGLVKDTPVPFMNGNQIDLNKQLFLNDALVFKNLVSTQITLRSTKSSHGIEFGFEEFPFFGIWSAPNANFLCLEPWCGIADGEQHDQELIHKEGIISLLPNQAFTRNWYVTVF